MSAHPRPAAAPFRKRLARLAAGAVLACLLCGLPGAALAVSDDPVLRRMDAVLEENGRLREEAWKARRNGRDAARQAEEALDASDERVERTRTEALAHVAGVSPAQVEALRRDGRSWGQAAGELGVHPGFLGIGKTPLYEPKRAAPAEADAGGKKGKKGKKGKDKAPEPEPTKGKKGVAKKGETKAKAKPAKEAKAGQKPKAKPDAKAEPKAKAGKKKKAKAQE